MCQQGHLYPRDSFLSPTATDQPVAPISDLSELQNQALAICRAAASSPSPSHTSTSTTSTSTTNTITRLQTGIQTAIQTLMSTSRWPQHRYPLPHFRQNLLITNINSKQYSSAFVQSLVLLFHVDPVLYPVPHTSFHPQEFVHLMLVFDLSMSLSLDCNMRSVANTKNADDAEARAIHNTPEAQDYLRGLRGIVLAKLQRFSARTAGWENGSIRELVERRAEWRRSEIVRGNGDKGRENGCEAFWQRVVEKALLGEETRQRSDQ